MFEIGREHKGFVGDGGCWVLESNELSEIQG